MGPFEIYQLEIAETEVATCIFPECVKLSRKKKNRNKLFFVRLIRLIFVIARVCCTSPVCPRKVQLDTSKLS